jgi:peroxiredoxin
MWAAMTCAFADMHAPVAAQEMQSARFPASLTDIDGQVHDIQKLAENRNLVVVTMKAPWCLVCHWQLVRIKALLPELQPCRVSFIVLVPGTPEQVAQVRERTEFAFPFVADEALEIATSLGLARGEDQIFPCMFQILPDRSIGWTQLGRNGGYFGDGELRDYFDCVAL